MITRIKSFTHIVSYGAASQAVSSLTNLTLGLYLLRTLGLAGYGQYTIAFAFLIFIASVLQNFFAIQMVVLSGAYETEKKKELATEILTTMIAVTTPVLLLLTILASLLNYIFGDALISTILIPVTMGATLAFALKEYFVRYFFMMSKAHLALYTNLWNAIILVLLLCASTIFDTFNVDVKTAVLFYGVSHLIAVLFAFSAAKFTVTCKAFKNSHPLFKRLLEHGIPSAATAAVAGIRGQAHTFILAILLGPAAVGAVNSVRLLITPATLIIPLTSQIILPMMSKAFHLRSYAGVRQVAWRSWQLLTLFVSVTILPIYLTWPFVPNILLKNYSDDAKVYFILWSAYAFVLVLRNTLEWCCQASMNFSQLFWASALITCFAIICSISGAIIIGERAVIAVLILTDGALAVYIFLLSLKQKKAAATSPKNQRA